MADSGASGLASCATTLFASTMVMWTRAGWSSAKKSSLCFSRSQILNAMVGRILQLLEEELGGGEALPEDDT
jgi:hypothetical protein